MLTTIFLSRGSDKQILCGRASWPSRQHLFLDSAPAAAVCGLVRSRLGGGFFGGGFSLSFLAIAQQ